MVTLSHIEGTEITWNPDTGCSKVSQGCKSCYAERMAKRLKAMGVGRYANGSDLALQEDFLDKPYRWINPSVVFVISMSGLFYEDLPVEFIQRVFNVMQECPHHTFQVLAKQSERLCALAEQLPRPTNIWMWGSVENDHVLHRNEHLRQASAHVRFLSCKPLTGLLDALMPDEIHWVIVGGESGPGARLMQSA